MNNLGIMQGRLTDKGGFYPQQFPWSNWQQEFITASAAEIAYIEWMFNYENHEKNPIWTENGRKQITFCENRTDVFVKSVCANYFMEKGLFEKGKPIDASFMILRRLIENMAVIGAKILVLPLFEHNMLSAELLCDESFRGVIKIAEMNHILIALETDWDASLCRRILEVLDSDYLGICYDLGNASGNGKDIISEIQLLKNKVLDIHIKDKPVGGATVMLGEGDVDFQKCFSLIQDIEYVNPMILESYYGETAVSDTLKNIHYIKNIRGYAYENLVYRSGERRTKASA